MGCAPWFIWRAYLITARTYLLLTAASEPLFSLQGVRRGKARFPPYVLVFVFSAGGKARLAALGWYCRPTVVPGNLEGTVWCQSRTSYKAVSRSWYLREGGKYWFLGIGLERRQTGQRFVNSVKRGAVCSRQQPY